MKKIVLIVALLIILLAIGVWFACSNGRTSEPIPSPTPDEPHVLTPTAEPTIPTDIIEPPVNYTPPYSNGHENGFESGDNPVPYVLENFALMFTQIPGNFLWYVDPILEEEFQVYRGQLSTLAEETGEHEMAMVTFIRFFDIDRETFDRLNAEWENFLIEMGDDPEPQELFNADIIFTFDNDIINEYYRIQR